ncbi:hypothetical protein KY338_04760 [Candidatus Woesearchaeota archaeon]|nr:hypothetical protein [Candidatus Woesearchaeota archaeon]MBW3006217.1 hypothetical protein [Candidatus Woesearchaeota archaeon]
MEQENALEKMLDAYQKIATTEELPAEVSLALYGMLAEQLPEDQRSGLYAGLAVGYAKLAEELSGEAKETAMGAAQMYMAVAASQYESIVQSKQKYASPEQVLNYKAARPNAA